MKMPLLLNVLAVCLLAVSAGCEPEVRIIRSSWDNLPADPKPKNLPRSQAYQDRAGGQGWAIQVIQFTGPTRHSQAMALAKQIRSGTGLSDIWIEDINDTATIYHGRFPTATDPAIRAALDKVRTIQLESEAPFAKSQLVPLVGGGRAIADPFDLRQFIGYYSLQIGFYDAGFGKDFREAAEQAVRVLREDGHEAYYYHGPYRSIITVGVFDYSQAFVRAGTVDTYAPQIRELQKQFPYNLSNGVTLLQKINGKDIGEQKSSLIRVL
jgi:hypothetical protein